MTTATRRECAWLTNPNGPEESDDLHQLFTLRSDGTGLRVLTDMRGLAVEADGTVTVELVGPFDYAPLGPTPQYRF